MTGTDSSNDWPLGPALRANRERSGLSIRAAAAAAHISEGKWRQLETGTYRAGGHTLNVRSTPITVAAAARAVRLDVAAALAMAGFNPDTYEHLQADDGPSPSDEVPGFGRLSERQKAAVVELVASILAVDVDGLDTDADSDGRAGLRIGRAPADLLARPDVKVLESDPDPAERANGSA